MADSRSGFALRNLVVVIGIIVVGIGIVVPAVQSVREASSRTQCICNLKQIGLALQNFHSSFKRYPVEGMQTGESFYIKLLPYIDQVSTYKLIQPVLAKTVAADQAAWNDTFGYGDAKSGFLWTPTATATPVHVEVNGEAKEFTISQGYQYAQSVFNQANPIVVVPAYLCPSRRDKSVGPKCDYGAACSVSIQGTPGSNHFSQTGTWLTILDAADPMAGPKAIGITTTAISAQAGTGYVILVSHKSLQPMNYKAHAGLGKGSVNDQGFATTFFSTGGNWKDGPLLYTGVWANPPVITPGFDHMRFADGQAAYFGTRGVQSTQVGYLKGYPRDDARGSDLLLGGPHSGGSPVLMCDGSVHWYSDGYTDPKLTADDCSVFQALWAWNRPAEFVRPPDE